MFHWLGAGHSARPLPLLMARGIARWSWLPLLLLAAQPVWREGAAGLWLLTRCLVVAVVVQRLSKWLSRRWQGARPFMQGLSPNHLGHSERAGFPSTHAMVMGAVLGFMSVPLHGHPVLAGMALTVLATAWARVYAGAHFPLDVIAGTGLGTVFGLASAWWILL